MSKLKARSAMDSDYISWGFIQIDLENFKGRRLQQYTQKSPDDSNFSIINIYSDCYRLPRLTAHLELCPVRFLPALSWVCWGNG